MPAKYLCCGIGRQSMHASSHHHGRSSRHPCSRGHVLGSFSSWCPWSCCAVSPKNMTDISWININATSHPWTLTSIRKTRGATLLQNPALLQSLFQPLHSGQIYSSKWFELPCICFNLLLRILLCCWPCTSMAISSSASLLALGSVLFSLAGRLSASLGKLVQRRRPLLVADRKRTEMLGGG